MPRAFGSTPEQVPPGAPILIADVLAAVVRGGSGADMARFDADEIYRAAEEHGLLPLVAERIADRHDVTEQLRSRLRHGANLHVMNDLVRESELTKLIAQIGAAGVTPLLMKGGQLAYSHYARPDLRPRLDTDILIPPDARETVHAVLLQLGYHSKVGQMSGTLVIYQALYFKRRDGQLLHAVDVHWKVASPQVFADVLSYAELAERAIALPQLGPSARGLGPADALLLACMHRIAHHLDSNRLIWLYDIHLVAQKLDQAEWNRFLDLTAERKIAAVCRRSLERTVARFRTEVPSWVWSDPRLDINGEAELSAGYLTPRPQAQEMVDELRALRRWRDRIRLVREHVFPPAAYMRQTYAPASAAPLVVLYARRFLRGALKWLRPSRRRDRSVVSER